MGESNDGVRALGGALTPLDPTGTLPGTPGTGCRALAKAILGEGGVLSLGSQPCPAQRKPNPRSSVPLEECLRSQGWGVPGGSASSLIPVSPRRVLTLEKKAEETFGFEIQVGSVLSCAGPGRATPCSPPFQPAPCFASRVFLNCL